MSKPITEANVFQAVRTKAAAIVDILQGVSVSDDDLKRALCLAESSATLIATAETKRRLEAKI